MGNKKSVLQAFSRKLAKIRKSQRMNMDTLANGVQVSKSYISLLEAGERQPSREVVLKIAKALGADDLLRDELLVAAGFTPVNMEYLSVPKTLIGIYEQALEQEAFDFRTYTGLITALIKAGHYDSAREKIQAGFQIFAESLYLQCLLASLELTKGNFDGALVIQKAAIEQFHLNPTAHQLDIHLSDLILNLGIIYFLKGCAHLTDKIEAEYQKKPLKANQEEEYALQYFHEAREQVSKSLVLNPDDIYALDEYARINFNLAALLKDPSQANFYWEGTIKGFKSVIYSRDKHSLGQEALLEACAFLAHAYTKSGQFEEAEYTIQLSLACSPGYWLLYYIEACFYSLKYERVKEVNLLELALESLAAAVKAGAAQVRQEALKDPDLKAVRERENKKFMEIVTKELKDGN